MSIRIKYIYNALEWFIVAITETNRKTKLV